MKRSDFFKIDEVAAAAIVAKAEALGCPSICSPPATKRILERAAEEALTQWLHNSFSYYTKQKKAFDVQLEDDDGNPAMSFWVGKVHVIIEPTEAKWVKVWWEGEER